MTDFGFRNRRGKPYPLAYCKPCHIEYHTEWRWTERGRRLYNLAENASKARYPERVRARKALNRALRRNQIAAEPCVVSGDCDGNVEAHHDDYSKPLDVRWVCRKHHRQLDRERQRAA